MFDKRKHAELRKANPRKRQPQAKGAHHAYNVIRGFDNEQEYEKAPHDHQDRENEDAENYIKQQAGDVY